MRGGADGEPGGVNYWDELPASAEPTARCARWYTLGEKEVVKPGKKAQRVFVTLVCSGGLPSALKLPLLEPGFSFLPRFGQLQGPAPCLGSVHRFW